MENYKTYAETEALLQTAIGLRGRTIKEIAEASGIKASMLYKWNTGKVHLSPQKQDQLLIYFIQNEPERLEIADLLNSGTYVPPLS